MVRATVTADKPGSFSDRIASVLEGSLWSATIEQEFRAELVTTASTTLHDALAWAEGLREELEKAGWHMTT